MCSNFLEFSRFLINMRGVLPSHPFNGAPSCLQVFTALDNLPDFEGTYTFVRFKLCFNRGLKCNKRFVPFFQKKISGAVASLF